VVCVCLLSLGAVTTLTSCDVVTSTEQLIDLQIHLSGILYPPYDKFAGNSTSLDSAAQDFSAQMAGVAGTVLLRQADCSVAGESFSKLALTTNSGYTGTFSGTFTPTATPDYGAKLHTLAGLTTTPGVFAKGCEDNIAGIAGQASVLLGTTTDGSYVGAATDINNDLYIGAIHPAGTYTATKSTFTFVVSMYVGDKNSEGIRQLIVQGLKTGITFPTSMLYTINVHADGTSDAPVLLATPYTGASYTTASFLTTVDDVTGDGKRDIVISGALGSNAIAVLPATGNGGFGAAIVSVTPTGEGGPLLTGDFNGDGKRDVVAAGSILFGKGDGTFTLGPAAPALGGQVVADFNNDGKDDIAGITAGGVSIALGKGDGTFTSLGPSYAVQYGAQSLAATDIDGDGNIDLVVGQGQSGVYGPPANGNGLTMFLMGNGDGTLHGAYGYGYSAGTAAHGAFASGDFDGDGKVDVLSIVTNQLGNTLGIQLLKGDGKGVLTAQPTITTVMPGFVAAADVNGDGKLDAVALAGGTDGSGNPDTVVSIVKGNGDGTFAAPVTYAVSSESVTSSNLAVGDVEGTGKPDVVVALNETLYLLKNNGDGTFTAATKIDTQTGYQSLVIADVNGDGKADIVATAGTQAYGTLTSGQLLVYLSKGGGTFSAPVAVTNVTNGQDAVVADVNKDGKPDIVMLASDATSGVFSLSAYLGKGDGTYGPAVSSSLKGQYMVGLAIADVDGDGKADVLIGACCGNTLSSIAYGNGDGTFGTNFGLSIGPSTNEVAFADLNNDGRPDLLLASNKTLVTSLNEFGSAVTTLAASTTTLTASPNPVTAGQTVTFTATVAAGSGTVVPTGIVNFIEDGSSLGMVTLSAQGVATLATAAMGVGTHSVTASYGGDSVFAASSSVVSLVVTTAAAADFGLSASPTAGTVTAGGSVQTTVSLAPAGGFANAVSLSCSGLPAYTTCGFSPASVTSDGTHVATSTMTIQTNVNSAALRRPGLAGMAGGVALAWLGGGGLFGLLMLRRRRKGGAWEYVSLGLAGVLMTCGLVLGCGGYTPTKTITTSPTTPAGTSTVTVTGTAGAVTHTATYTLTVQ
jgi:hypothetical protein